MFGGFDEFVGAAGVKNGVGRIVDMFADQVRVDAAAAAGPEILRVNARASDVEIEIWIFLLKLEKFFVEDDVVRRANAVEDRDARFKLAARRFAHETAKRRDAAAAGDA